jgi:hypothetical protein
MYASWKCLIAGSALALVALPALATEESAPTVAPERLPVAVVKCLEVSGVPVTADEAQALPLHVVGLLGCGETVAVLSDRDGYTMRIRTTSGQEGYVARMYLSAESAVATQTRARKASVSSAHPVNGVARWAAGAPGCDEFISHGRHVESITANGITVQVSVQDSGWKYRANVAVSNQSKDAVSILPGIVTLDELSPTVRPLYAVDTVKIAHSPTHQVLWTLVNAVPSRSAVADFSNVSEAQRLADRESPAPDYLNPRLELASSRRSGFDRTDDVDVQSIALKPAAVLAGQIDAGVMWFERDNNAHELSMRVPVGGMVFDFAFSLEQKK